MHGKRSVTIALEVFSFLAAGGLLASLRAQTQPDTTAQSKPVNVNILATVRDKHGKIVPTLNKDDFILEEDGRPQTVQNFSHQSDLPLTLGLIVDTSMNQRRALEAERNDSSNFLDRMLRVDKDQAFLIHFDREVELLQDLTASSQKLHSALTSLQTRQASQTSDDNQGQGQGYPGRRGGGQGQGRRGGSQLYDAVFLASDEVLKNQTGRKALIVFSDGVDRGSKESLTGAIEAAQRANTVVYSILIKGSEPQSGGFGRRGGMGRYPGGGPGRYPSAEPRVDGKKILEQVSRETGGRMFEASSGDSMEKTFTQIAEDLRNQYNFAYTPDRTDTVGYRKISLKAKQKDLIVQSREGYYSGGSGDQVVR